ncbi:MAG: cyclic phosphodiesterase-like protein [Parcubacteria group bacterium]|nr:cyclic phosphodiesterase-like protein [Parcubacteria group bacterium]
MNPSDNTTTGFHLFLMPSGELKETLSGVIKTLAERYQGVLFEPHVTLMKIPEGNEEQVISLAQSFAQNSTPITLSLEDMGMEETFFRALYLKVNPNEALEALHARAANVFGLNDAGAFTPHLSLFYGNVPEDLKREMVSSLTLPLPLTFIAESLHVYKTGGTTEQWEQIAEYPFPKS